MEVAYIIFAITICVLAIIIAIRGLKPLEFELPGWVGNSVAWVKRIIKNN